MLCIRTIYLTVHCPTRIADSYSHDDLLIVQSILICMTAVQLKLILKKLMLYFFRFFLRCVINPYGKCEYTWSSCVRPLDSGSRGIFIYKLIFFLIIKSTSSVCSWQRVTGEVCKLNVVLTVACWSTMTRDSCCMSSIADDKLYYEQSWGYFG